MSNRNRRTVTTEVEPRFLQSCADMWAKGCKRGAKWDKDTFEDFPVCVHWFRQMVAAIVGITLGTMGAMGAGSLVGGFGFTMAITHAYYTFFVEADEMSYSDNGLKMEGTFPAFAMFLLTWIVMYTAMGYGGDGSSTLTP